LNSLGQTTMHAPSLRTPLRPVDREENIDPASLEHIECWRADRGLCHGAQVPSTGLTEGKKLAFKKIEAYSSLLLEVACLTRENDALRNVMHHSGHFDSKSTEGLIKRRGAPVTAPSERAGRVILAANSILEMSIIVQGPDLAANMVALVQAATAKDPSVPSAIAKGGMIPEISEQVPDKRWKTASNGAWADRTCGDCKAVDGSTHHGHSSLQRKCPIQQQKVKYQSFTDRSKRKREEREELE
jgi:hypothetical protein